MSPADRTTTGTSRGNVLQRAVAAPAGAGLAAAAAALGVLRASRPLHPNGQCGQGQLRVYGASSGLTILDQPGQHDCLVRASYAVGTGPRLPDIEGLAVRLTTAPPTDMLFASTGAGRWSRFTLVARRPGHHGALGSLLPVQGDRGVVFILLTPDQPSGPEGWPTSYELSWASTAGAWTPCADLQIDWLPGAPDTDVRFEPVRHPWPGVRQLPWVQAIRAPAYTAARRAFRS